MTPVTRINNPSQILNGVLAPQTSQPNQEEDRVRPVQSDITAQRAASRQRLDLLTATFNRRAGQAIAALVGVPVGAALGIAQSAALFGLSVLATPFAALRDALTKSRDPIEELQLLENEKDLRELKNLEDTVEAMAPDNLDTAIRYVAAGRKIIEALKVTDYGGGPLTIDIGGKTKEIRPGLQTVRALLWYLKAKAGGDPNHLTVSGALAGRLFHFLNSAPVTYRRGGWFGRLFRTERERKERGIEDFSNKLPGGMGAVAFSLEDTGTLHLKLERVGTPTVWGTSRHDDTRWTTSIWHNFISPFRGLRHLWNRLRCSGFGDPPQAAKVELGPAESSSASYLNEFYEAIDDKGEQGEIRMGENGQFEIANRDWLCRKFKNVRITNQARHRRAQALDAFRRALVDRGLSQELVDFMLAPAKRRGYLKVKDVRWIRTVLSKKEPTSNRETLSQLRQIFAEPAFRQALDREAPGFWQRLSLTGLLKRGLSVAASYLFPGFAIAKEAVGGAYEFGKNLQKLEDQRLEDKIKELPDNSKFKSLLQLMVKILESHYLQRTNTGFGRMLSSPLAMAPGGSFLTQTTLSRALSRPLPHYLFTALGHDYRTVRALLAYLSESEERTKDWSEEEKVVLNLLLNLENINIEASS